MFKSFIFLVFFVIHLSFSDRSMLIFSVTDLSLYQFFWLLIQLAILILIVCFHLGLELNLMGGCFVYTIGFFHSLWCSSLLSNSLHRSLAPNQEPGLIYTGGLDLLLCGNITLRQKQMVQSLGVKLGHLSQGRYFWFPKPSSRCLPVSGLGAQQVLNLHV